MPNTDPILALDIGGTKIGWASVVAGETPRIGERGAIPTLADQGGVRVAERIAQLVSERCTERQYSAVAIASAGVVDPESGAIVSATNTMPGWAGTPLGEIVSTASNLPVRALNDVHAHGLGEARLGAGRGFRSVLSVAVGTGIGGAYVSDGEVSVGEHFLAGHVGHVHHSYAAGVTCTCGRVGHIEGICSGFGIAAWYNSRAGADVTEVSGSREVGERAESDPLAREIITQAGEALGDVIGSLANVLDPAVVVLSGSVTGLGHPWWAALQSGYGRTAMDAVANLPIRAGELGSDAPLLGAVLNLEAAENRT